MKTWSYGINSLLSDLRGRKGKGQKSEVGCRRTEDRGQKTEGRWQRADGRGQRSEQGDLSQGMIRMNGMIPAGLDGRKESEDTPVKCAPV